MNPGPPPTPSAIALPPEQFAAAFPFHLAVDRDLRLRQAGATLQKLCADLRPGARLQDCFRSIRPEGPISLAWVLDHRLRFFLLEHQATKLQLRGEFLLLPAGDTLLFLGSPWFTDTGEIAARGLGFGDFAIHDPAVDLLQAFQASKVALADAKKLAAKLTEQRAELRVANERLRQQETDTKKLALIAARTDNSVVLTDAQGRIEWVNEGFTRLTGYPPAEAIGQRPGALLQGPGTDPETVRMISARLQAQEGFSAEILNYSKSGRSYWISIEVQPIRDEQGRLTNFMALQSDISARRAAQQRLAIQLDVSRALAEVNNFGSAVPRLLQAVCENLGWQVGLLWRRQGASLRYGEAWHPIGAGVSAFVGTSRVIGFSRGEGLPGRVWATGREQWLSDVTKDSGFPRAAVAAREDLHGAFAFPVLVRGEIWGVFEFFNRRIEEPDGALLQTFAVVGHQIGQFIVRREAEEALLETNTLQRAILEGASYSIIAMSKQGTIQTFNSAAERMLGYASAEVVGLVTPLLFHDPAELALRAGELSLELDRPVEPGIEVICTRAARGESDEREWIYRRKDGTSFPALLSVTALRNERAQVSGYLCVASDITERKRVAGELVQAKEAAETASRAKSEFLAMMSHEIRTPMNAVIGMANLLLETRLDEKQTEFAQTVARSGESLLELINDILDFSKIEAGGQLPLEEDSFSLPGLVNGMVQMLRPRATSGGIALTAQLDPNLPTLVMGDAGRLRQVLVNLAGNGIKFTDHGNVVIRVQNLVAVAPSIRVRFEVEDTGIGITAAEVKRLFQPFTQADSSASRRRGGTGLGLAISKRIVELMGGRTGVESTPGRGSLFWFEVELKLPPTLPQGISPPAHAEVFAPDSGAAGLSPTPGVRPLRILVAEDHDTNRRLVRFMLESLGYRANFAANGFEAIDAWERYENDVILMDCQMPEMDGFQATHEIRRREAARPATSRPPVRIIALTANALKGDRERCLAAGMDAYISKPFTAQQLRAALEERPPATVASVAPAPSPPPIAVPVPPIFDPERPTELCLELGDEGVSAIIDDFLADLPQRIAELSALAGTDRRGEVARLAHSLQGISLSFGLVQLGGQLRALELAAGPGNDPAWSQLIGPLPEMEIQAQHELRRWLDSRRGLAPPEGDGPPL